MRPRLKRELATVAAMLRIFCRAHHSRGSLCADCSSLLSYAEQRLALCPFGEEKPPCADCTVHCYDPAHRQRIREVMRFSGLHFVKRGRLDWLVRYFWS